MSNNKQNFWRGFTWKRFLLWSIYWFVSTLLVTAAIDYFDSKAIVSDNFTTTNLIKKAIGSLIIGFFIALWFEPGLDGKKKTQEP